MESHIQYVLYRVRECRGQGKRVVFVGFDETIFAALVNTAIIQNLDFELASPIPKFFGVTARFPGIAKVVRPLETIGEMHPQLVVILPCDGLEPGACFDRIMAMRIVSTIDVIMPPEVWSARLTGSTDVATNFASQMPKIHGGLSSPELVTHIGEAIAYIARCNVPGDIVNMGVYHGWSLYLCAMLMEHYGLTDRILWGFDTFEGFVDVDSLEESFVQHLKATYGENWNIHSRVSFEVVKATFSRFPFVRLVKGDIGQTVNELKGRDLAFVLSDMDDYSPTAVSLDCAYNQLVPGGILAHDHFSFSSLNAGSCYGQRQAMLEFLEKQPMLNFRGTNMFVKSFHMADRSAK